MQNPHIRRSSVVIVCNLRYSKKGAISLCLLERSELLHTCQPLSIIFFKNFFGRNCPCLYYLCFLIYQCSCVKPQRFYDMWLTGLTFPIFLQEHVLLEYQLFFRIRPMLRDIHKSHRIPRYRRQHQVEGLREHLLLRLVRSYGLILLSL